MRGTEFLLFLFYFGSFFVVFRFDYCIHFIQSVGFDDVQEEILLHYNFNYAKSWWREQVKVNDQKQKLAVGIAGGTDIIKLGKYLPFFSFTLPPAMHIDECVVWWVSDNIKFPLHTDKVFFSFVLFSMSAAYSGKLSKLINLIRL